MRARELTAEERAESFDCFGSRCTVLVGGEPDAAAQAATLARRRLLDCHRRFTRFEADSELSRLNRDPRDVVPVSALMARFVRAVLEVASLTGGLVDPTLLPELEALERDGPGEPARARRGRAHPARRWRRIDVDPRAGTVSRPPGVRLDSGGFKGFFADVVGEGLAGARGVDGFAVDCGGDVRIGGPGRAVRVQSPFDTAILHELRLESGGVATSGIVKRGWTARDGHAAHHLLDPATGLPCFSGVVQATAIAPSALHAEALAKAALLSGPERGERWLRFGGVLVFGDGGHRVVTPAVRRVSAPRLLQPS